MSKALKVIAGAPDRPLIIGDIEIPCYVLEGETRVLSQRGLQSGVGLGVGGSKQRIGAPRIAEFIESLKKKGIDTKGLAARLNSAVEFQPVGGGRTAYAYPATILVDLCDIVLEARDAGVLHARQANIAQRADILIRGLATIGIIGLVDEATGYQRIREERSLAAILEKFITHELQPWTKTFPYEFYKQIFRLKGWPGPDGHKRPPLIGLYTNQIVYDRLAPGVLDELKLRTPKLPSGKRRNKFFQWFTPDYGHPKLKEHLAGVIALMRAAPNWTTFQRSLKRAFPKPDEQQSLPLGDDE